MLAKIISRRVMHVAIVALIAGWVALSPTGNALAYNSWEHPWISIPGWAAWSQWSADYYCRNAFNNETTITVSNGIGGTYTKRIPNAQIHTAHGTYRASQVWWVWGHVNNRTCIVNV